MTSIRKIDEFEYLGLLKSLADDGDAYAKTTPRHAYRWPALVIHTETSNGQIETAKEIDPDVYIVFDPAGFPTESDRAAAFLAVIDSFHDKAARQEDLRAVDFRGPDLWIMEGKKFRAEYEPDPIEKNKYQPNEEARTAPRQCFIVPDSIEFPVQWGTFVVEAGGAIAVRVSDLSAVRAAITEAEQNIASIKAQNAADIDTLSRDVIRQALYKPDGTTVFDVYGMKPGFLEKNYDAYKQDAVIQKPPAPPKPPKA